MIPNILLFIYIGCDALAFVCGTVVLIRLMNGELQGNLAVLFLRSALATSVVGILLRSNHRFLTTSMVSVLTVCVSGLAVLAWRKQRLTGIWRSVFAFTSAILLYLCLLLPVMQLFAPRSPLEVLFWAHYDFTSRLLWFAVLVLFVLLGIAAVRSFRDRPSHPYLFIAKHR